MSTLIIKVSFENQLTKCTILNCFKEQKCFSESFNIRFLDQSGAKKIFEITSENVSDFYSAGLVGAVIENILNKRSYKSIDFISST